MPFPYALAVPAAIGGIQALTSMFRKTPDYSPLVAAQGLSAAASYPVLGRLLTPEQQKFNVNELYNLAKIVQELSGYDTKALTRTMEPEVARIQEGLKSYGKQMADIASTGALPPALTSRLFRQGLGAALGVGGAPGGTFTEANIGRLLGTGELAARSQAAREAGGIEERFAPKPVGISPEFAVQGRTATEQANVGAWNNAMQKLAGIMSQTPDYGSVIGAGIGAASKAAQGKTSDLWSGLGSMGYGLGGVLGNDWMSGTPGNQGQGKGVGKGGVPGKLFGVDIMPEGIRPYDMSQTKGLSLFDPEWALSKITEGAKKGYWNIPGGGNVFSSANWSPTLTWNQ